MKKLTVLMKPVSSLCQMECQYCFYKDIMKHRKMTSLKMTRTIYVSIINEVLSYHDIDEIEFCFQGGEPLLIGIDFYKDFINEVHKRKSKCKIQYSIQTNGILLDHSWIELFKENCFFVGVSMDGIDIVHNHYRRFNNHDSYENVLKGIELLKSHHIDFNILSVVTPKMVPYAKEIYQYYQEKEFHYIQFIPCLPSLDGNNGLSPKEFYQFYKRLYDEYQKNKDINISLFEQIIHLFQGQRTVSCGMLGYCALQIVIEANGDIYPCDFYAIDKYRLGNICTDSLKTCFQSAVAYSFLREDKNYSLLCDECEFYTMCQGNCKRQNVCLFDDEYCGYQELLRYIKESDYVRKINEKK